MVVVPSAERSPKVPARAQVPLRLHCPLRDHGGVCPVPRAVDGASRWRFVVMERWCSLLVGANSHGRGNVVLQHFQFQTQLSTSLIPNNLLLTLQWSLQVMYEKPKGEATDLCASPALTAPRADINRRLRACRRPRSSVDPR